MPQSGECLLLDLSNALSRDPHHSANLLERHRVLAVESEVQAEDTRFAFLQGRQHFPDGIGEGSFERLLVRPGILGVGQLVEQFVVFAGREWRIQRKMGLGDREGLRQIAACE